MILSNTILRFMRGSKPRASGDDPGEAGENIRRLP